LQSIGAWISTWHNPTFPWATFIAKALDYGFEVVSLWGIHLPPENLLHRQATRRSSSWPARCSLVDLQLVRRARDGTVGEKEIASISHPSRCSNAPRNLRRIFFNLGTGVDGPAGNHLSLKYVRAAGIDLLIAADPIPRDQRNTTVCGLILELVS
jgi:hypothetical protein